MRHSAICAALLSLLIFFPTFAGAHAIGENYLFLSISKKGEVTGRFEFHINDLKEKLNIDLGKPDEGLLGRVDANSEKVHAYIMENFSMAGDGVPIPITFTKRGLLKEGSVYIQYHFTSQVKPIPDVLTFKHEMMYEDDRMHRGMVVMDYNPVTDTTYGEEFVALMFDPKEETHELDLRETFEPLRQPLDFIWQGVLHIWIGIDHILFLVVLLLPAVLRREGGQWLPVESCGKALWNIAKIVTLFTIAHSITLALAALGYVNLPGPLVESVIALSIVLVALNNIRPTVKAGSAFVIVALGLFHGLGFASVMSDLPFRMLDLKMILLAFNVGVELGQLAIVAAVFLVLFPLRRWEKYVPVILIGGSVLAGLRALVWFFERAFGL